MRLVKHIVTVFVFVMLLNWICMCMLRHVIRVAHPQPERPLRRAVPNPRGQKVCAWPPLLIGWALSLRSWLSSRGRVGVAVCRSWGAARPRAWKRTSSTPSKLSAASTAEGEYKSTAMYSLQCTSSPSYHGDYVWNNYSVVLTLLLVQIYRGGHGVFALHEKLWCGTQNYPSAQVTLLLSQSPVPQTNYNLAWRPPQCPPYLSLSEVVHHTTTTSFCLVSARRLLSHINRTFGTLAFCRRCAGFMSHVLTIFIARGCVCAYRCICALPQA